MFTSSSERGPAVPAISRDEVAHLARLSRLALSDAELDEFAGQLDSILNHVKVVTEVAADDVPPMANPNAVTNVTRPDVIVPGLTPSRHCPEHPQSNRIALRFRRSLERANDRSDHAGRR